MGLAWLQKCKRRFCRYFAVQSLLHSWRPHAAIWAAEWQGSMAGPCHLFSRGSRSCLLACLRWKAVSLLIPPRALGQRASRFRKNNTGFTLNRCEELLLFFFLRSRCVSSHPSFLKRALAQSKSDRLRSTFAQASLKIKKRGKSCVLDVR